MHKGRHFMIKVTLYHIILNKNIYHLWCIMYYYLSYTELLVCEIYIKITNVL